MQKCVNTAANISHLRICLYLRDIDMDQVMARKLKGQGHKGIISKIKVKEGQVIEETIKVGIGLIQIVPNTIIKLENVTRIAGGEITTGGPVHLTASLVVPGLPIDGPMREDDHQGEGKEEGDTEGEAEELANTHMLMVPWIVMIGMKATG